MAGLVLILVLETVLLAVGTATLLTFKKLPAPEPNALPIPIDADPFDIPVASCL